MTATASMRCASGNAGLPVPTLAQGTAGDTMDQHLPQLRPAPPMSKPPALPFSTTRCSNGLRPLSGGRSA